MAGDQPAPQHRPVTQPCVVGEFAPGERCTELQVDAVLRAYHQDVAALRRYLVENGFMDREAGWYWRIGGSLDMTDGTATPAADEGTVRP